MSYLWELGDGSNETGAEVTHSYQKAGNYTVNLTVTDNGGARSSDNLTVKVTVRKVQVEDMRVLLGLRRAI